MERHMSPSSDKVRVGAGEVIARMRRRITDDYWPPGARIPIKQELASEFAASGGTIQKALNQLSKEGFLHSRGRLGTFVTSHPPHRHRVGLVLPTTPAGTDWYSVLMAAAEELTSSPARRLRTTRFSTAAFIEFWRKVMPKAFSMLTFQRRAAA